jgi:hypothetical protein
MLSLIVIASRLLNRYAMLGGMAGFIVFTVQGEFLKAAICAGMTLLFIILLTLVTASGEYLKRKLEKLS